MHNYLEPQTYCAKKKITLPAFRWYCEQRMRWNSTTFNIIDWDIFLPVYQKQAKKNLQWNKKFCLRHIPMGSQLNRINNCKVIQCCSCGANVEDDDHLFQCKTRSDFMKHIRHKLKKYRDEFNPKLFHLWSDGIYTYVKGMTLPFIQTC